VRGIALGRRDGDDVGKAEAVVGSKVAASGEADDGIGVAGALGVALGETTGSGEGLLVVGMSVGRKVVGEIVHL
jgi:hypothetical protein